MKQVLNILKMASKYAAIGLIVVKILDFLIPEIEEISNILSDKSESKPTQKPNFKDEIISEQSHQSWAEEQQSGESEENHDRVAG